MPSIWFISSITESGLDQILTYFCGTRDSAMADTNETFMGDHHHHESKHSHHPMSSTGHSGSGHGDHSMPTYFHSTYNAIILFYGWRTESLGQIMASCVGIFIFAVLFEGIKYLRAYLLRNEKAAPFSLENVEPEGTDGKIRVVFRRGSFFDKICRRDHLYQTVLHVSQFIIGYSLMLIFMTYNIWLCLAVATGIGFGFFIFGADRVMDHGLVQNGDCCH